MVLSMRNSEPARFLPQPCHARAAEIAVREPCAGTPRGHWGRTGDTPGTHRGHTGDTPGTHREWSPAVPASLAPAATGTPAVVLLDIPRSLRGTCVRRIGP